MNDKKLKRSKDRKIAGVAGGIAEYLNVDPVIIRALFLFLIFFGGSGIILYFVLLLIMPEDNEINSPKTEYAETVDYTVIDDEGEEIKVNGEEKGEGKKDEDAYRNEEIKEQKNVKNNTKTGSAILGICFVFIGLFFLLRNIIPDSWQNIYFPALLIFTGILLIIIPFITRKKK